MTLTENKDFTARGYIAPTVFLRGDKYLSNYNYYNSMDAVVSKLSFLKGWGGTNVPPAGMVSFENNQQPQTFGINVDFFVLIGSRWEYAEYGFVKSAINGSGFPPCVFRFFTPQGTGPYFAILDKFYFGIAALAVSDADPAKVAALDAFYREVQILKYRYNSFVGFLNALAKRPLNQIEQQVYNEGLILLNTYSNQLGTLRGVEIQFDNSGRVGLPVIAIIAIIAVISGAAAWTISSITQETERTKRINDSYELQKWVAQKKIDVGVLVQNGSISQQTAAQVNQVLDQAAGQAVKVADQAAKQKTSLGSIADIAKWGVIGYIGFLIASQLTKRNAG